MSTSELVRSTCLVIACVVSGCSKQPPSEAGPKEGTPEDGRTKPTDANPPAVSKGPEAKEPKSKGPEAKEPKEFRETAESFTSAFETDYPAAVKKYAGNTVEVTGDFVELFPNTRGGEPEMVLRLRGCAVSGNPGFARLHCKVTDKQFESDPRIRGLARGQSITLRGKPQDNRDASVTDCAVVKVGPSTAIPTTLREIEEEVGKYPDTFGRFKDRDVVVKVTLGDPRFTSSMATFPVVTPKGGKKAFAFVGQRMGEEYDKELTAIKAGDEVLFVARLDKPLAPLPSLIELSGTRLLKSLPEGVKLPETPK